MSSKPVKILLTGLPGCGKTTAVKQIVEKLRGVKAAGFYTQEIRENNTRKGFRWKCLGGGEGILAHVDIKGHFRVGKYGVDVAGFEKSVVPILDAEKNDAKLFVIDEIGKMECFSEKFVVAVRRLLDSDKSVIATVAKKGGGFIREVKNYPNAALFNISRNDYDKIIAEVLRRISP